MKTILVVDDELMVVQMVEAILTSRGYHVLCAESGDNAFDMIEVHKANIELLITNHCLKSESGRDVAKRLHVLQPQMKVLQISGYPEEKLVADGTKVPGGDFLQKPFMPSQLVSKVQSILDGQEGLIDSRSK